MTESGFTKFVSADIEKLIEDYVLNRNLGSFSINIMDFDLTLKNMIFIDLEVSQIKF